MGNDGLPHKDTSAPRSTRILLIFSAVSRTPSPVAEMLFDLKKDRHLDRCRSKSLSMTVWTFAREADFIVKRADIFRCGKVASYKITLAILYIDIAFNKIQKPGFDNLIV